MAIISIEIKGGEDLVKLGREFEQAFKQELDAAFKTTMQEGQTILKQTMREANAIASGLSLNLVTARIKNSAGQGWRLSGDIEFKPPADRYIKFADKGRGAGKMPPLARIISWASSKGLPQNLAYPIARQIGLRGTATSKWNLYGRTPFLETSERRIKEMAEQEFAKIEERVQRRLDANANNRSRRT